MKKKEEKKHEKKHMHEMKEKMAPTKKMMKKAGRGR